MNPGRRPRTGVVIPARNAAHFISTALDSVLGQTVTIDDVVVVDDGSTDDTAAVVGRYGNPVRVVRQEPSGLPAARNAGVAATGAERILFLDADDVLEPECAARLGRKMDTGSDLGLVHCGFLAVDRDLRPIRTRLRGVEGDPRAALLLPDGELIHGGGTGTLVQKQAFDVIGGFDETMNHSEDWDFCFRMGTRFKLGFVPEALFLYRIHDGNMHQNVEAMQRNMLYAFSKAFFDADPGIHRLRRRAYSQLHSTLAGSYLHSRRPGHAIAHLVRGIMLYPPQAAYALRLPQRAAARRRDRTGGGRG
jgi:glycosyltransferase involved in cell wall biosynthesis